MVKFKYERLGTYCYICGLMGHSDNKCPKLLDMADTTNVIRNWGPELRAEMGRRQGGESRWLRQGGDPNWIAPNPVMMSNKGSSSTSENNGKDEDPKITSDIFRKPELFFPKLIERKTNVVHGEENMEEDVTEELVLKSDRKRSRSQPNNETVIHGLHVNEEHNENYEAGTQQAMWRIFLLVGPGGARQGQ
ncbi:hypothetical protein A2U01_0016721 [Trifolium medium]|uniref:CCHC-type domain-containing protein n=1 Tax=Trifolium medium TaxID=97028 RepID=A0A392N7F9_9FABA|nr:hypothetical protein [Trifolium medium]